MELVSEVTVGTLARPGILASSGPNTKSPAEEDFKLEVTLIANIVSSGILLN